MVLARKFLVNFRAGVDLNSVFVLFLLVLVVLVVVLVLLGVVFNAGSSSALRYF